ncbi:MAG TPA: hypothetical protein VG916_15350, partial [Gemmatimonadaceae bacterium]|nr:hypothetical protein [Gemmatimonadaceae bacterium]
GANPLNILAPPGRYTVRLRVGSTELRQPLRVLRDPDGGGAPTEIAEQTAMLVTIAKALESAGGLYANIDNVRGQLAATMDRAGTPADVRAAADSVERKFAFLADSLTQQNPGAFYEWPVKLISQLNYLASEVGSSDRRPTDQARQAYAVLDGELALVRRAYVALVQRELARLNELLSARGIPPVIVSQP